MKRIVIRILLIITALIVIVAIIGYFFYKADKPWLAFYIGCCGGALAVNLFIAIFFVNKNFKDKDSA